MCEGQPSIGVSNRALCTALRAGCKDTARESTISYVLEHEVCDKHWAQLSASHGPKSLESGLCWKICLAHVGETLAHCALESCKLWLQHSAPWRMDIQQICLCMRLW